MNLKICIIFAHFISFCFVGYSYIIKPGPLVIATKGGVWPKPQYQVNSTDFLILNIKQFQFRITGKSCTFLQDALSRYLKIIRMDRGNNAVFDIDNFHGDTNFHEHPMFVGYLNKLDVHLLTPCEGLNLPEVDMKEEYVLTITKENEKNALSADCIWGIFRGLETFAQLIYQEPNDLPKINSTFIYDFPRFSYRGLMVDTSRHFIPMDKLLLTLDGMSYNKLNVFHWHITDDQSFPYISSTFPQMSAKGAYTQYMTYSSTDVQKIIRYAAARGIRVIAEFDTPGHTRSWGLGIPGLLTPCYINGTLSGEYGPIDPTQPSTYLFLEKFFAEVLSVFPDPYIHLGADEVEFECWESNPKIKEFMERNHLKNYTDMEDYYVDKLLHIVNKLDGSPIVWEEVFTNNITFDKRTIVHVWKDAWNSTIANVTKAGYNALLSGGFYLDHPGWGGDWEKFYKNEPTNFTGTAEQKKLVLGGEACMWSESVNEYNIESRVWPRASAVAEKLWSALDADIWQNATARLEEHTCRMNRRGIGAQPPNGPGFCIL